MATPARPFIRRGYAPNPPRLLAGAPRPAPPPRGRARARPGIRRGYAPNPPRLLAGAPRPAPPPRGRARARPGIRRGYAPNPPRLLAGAPRPAPPPRGRARARPGIRRGYAPNPTRPVVFRRGCAPNPTRALAGPFAPLRSREPRTCAAAAANSIGLRPEPYARVFRGQGSSPSSLAGLSRIMVSMSASLMPSRRRPSMNDSRPSVCSGLFC